MSYAPGRIFRASAIERLSSPEQLDQLVRITRPFDWLASAVVCLAIAILTIWSTTGRIATRVSGEGMLISDGGVADAVSGAAGRLNSIAVSVGDRVSQGQVIARIAQTDAEQRHRDAVEALREQEQEHAELMSALSAGIASTSASLSAQEAALNETIAVAEQRVTSVLQAAPAGELAEDRRRELADTRQRIDDARIAILGLKAQRADLQARGERDRIDSEFRLNELRRQVQHLAAALEQASQVVSPVEGRVVEVKASIGATLSAGAPIAVIGGEGASLSAVIYIPAEHGKSVKPEMEVRVEASAATHKQFGALQGKVVRVSDFPVTPQGIAAAVHNDTLVTHFSRQPYYEVVVKLVSDERGAGGNQRQTGAGPPAGLTLTAGTLVRAEVTISQRPPIGLVLPFFTRASGTGG
jgi:HlyD family secretion protein